MKNEEIVDIMVDNFEMPDRIKFKRPKKGCAPINFSLTNKMIFHAMIFETILKQLDLFYDEPELYITGAHDDKGHSDGSLHYSGLALDFRTWNLTDRFLNAKYNTVAWQGAISNAWVSIANELPDYYFIVHFGLKNPHVHFQYGLENITINEDTNTQGTHGNLIIKPENNKITI